MYNIRPISEAKKNIIEIKIDCIMWYSANWVTLFFNKAVIISQTKPTPPAVRYVAAQSILSIGYGFLEVGN